MKRFELDRSLAAWDARGRRVFTVNDLRKLFPEESTDAFLNQMRKMASEEDPVIRRAARGVYVYTRSAHPVTNLIEEVAKTIRRGSTSYVSLESALSEHGWISQMPVGRITVMTTGRSGEFKTPWGDIEFTHTDREWSEFYGDLVDTGRPLKFANPDRALRDLKRVGRNVHLVKPVVEEAPLAQLS